MDGTRVSASPMMREETYRRECTESQRREWFGGSDEEWGVTERTQRPEVDVGPTS